MNRKERRAAKAQGASPRQDASHPLNMLFNDALVHHQSGRLAEAEALYRRILANGPNAVVHNNLGNILKDLGRTEEALLHYGQAIAIKPDYAEAHNNLGVALLERANIEEAIASFKKTIELRPDFAGPYFNLANALVNLGALENAVPLYRKALTIEPRFAGAYNNLGNVLKDMGKIDESLAQYQQAIAIMPDNPEFHFNVGNILNEKGMTDAAVSHLRRSLALDREDTCGARLILAGLGLEPIPERASEAHMQSLYTQRAHTWDGGTSSSQAYRGHELVAGAFKNYYKGSAKPDILDAGCGTGLVGELIRESAGTLEGVDISAAMLTQAHSKGIYASLHQGDLVEYLSHKPASYDVITCAATLIHFGDLYPAFCALRGALRGDGLFIATLFPNDNDDHGFAVAPLGLGQGGCYTHGQSYIKALAQDNGFKVEALETHIHEYIKGEPKMGLLVVLRRLPQLE